MSTQACSHHGNYKFIRIYQPKKQDLFISSLFFSFDGGRFEGSPCAPFEGPAPMNEGPREHRVTTAG
jgi:hypothetical protein